MHERPADDLRDHQKVRILSGAGPLSHWELGDTMEEVRLREGGDCREC